MLPTNTSYKPSLEAAGQIWLLLFQSHERTLINCAMALLVLTLSACGLACGQTQTDIKLLKDNMQPKSMPPPLHVKNEAAVTVHMRGVSPLETCKLGDRKTIDIEAKNALEEFVKALANFGAFGFGPGASDPAILLEEKTTAFEEQRTLGLALAKGNLDQAADKQILRAAQLLQDVGRAQRYHWILLKTASTQLAERMLKQDFRRISLSAFNQEIADRASEIKAAQDAIVTQERIDKAQAEVHEGALLLSVIHKLRDAQLAENPPNLRFISGLDVISDLNQAALSRILEAGKVLENQTNLVKSAFDQVVAIKDHLASVPDPENGLVQDLLLATDRNVKVTQSISCISLLDKTKITLDPVPLTVTYQNVPRLTFSAGAVFSTLNKRQIGTSLVKTGTDGSGVATLKTTIAVTDQAAAQVIPFSFLNFKLYDRTWASRTFTFNLSGDAGVNANSGTKEPEFFSGVAFGLDRMLVHVGVHTGRLQQLRGGFQIGDTVPDKLPSDLPIGRSYENRFAVALSFRIAP